MREARHKRTNTIRCHLHELCRVVKHIEMETRVVVARGWEKEEKRGS